MKEDPSQRAFTAYYLLEWNNKSNNALYAYTIECNYYVPFRKLDSGVS